MSDIPTTESPALEHELRNGTLWLWLNRPAINNAFDDRLIAQLTVALEQAAADDSVRAVVLGGRGKHFSAGADFHWMQRMVDLDHAGNVADALALARLMRTLHALPKPTIALVQGAAYGGALGLVCACDIALAADNATFCLSEVKLGLIPAVISPYVVAAMGTRQAARWFLTAEAFDAVRAREIGVVHDVVAASELQQGAEKLLATLLGNGPQAVLAAKRLIRDVAGRAIDDGLLQLTAERIAAIRVGAEGQEGLRAFLEKRTPAWRNSL